MGVLAGDKISPQKPISLSYRPVFCLEIVTQLYFWEQKSIYYVVLLVPINSVCFPGTAAWGLGLPE